MTRHLHAVPDVPEPRTEIARTARGHVVTENPMLVARARKAIRQRRDLECEVRIAA